MFLSVMKVLIDYMYFLLCLRKGQEKKVICDCLKGCLYQIIKLFLV